MRVTAQIEARAMESHKKMGRPLEYDDAKADKICSLISEGMPLIKITRLEGMPSAHTIYHWMRLKPDFLQRYQQARQDQADTLAEEVLTISDDTEHADDPVQVAAARLRVDSRKWVAARLKPHKWGDKASLELTGADGASLPVVAISFVAPEPRETWGEVIENGK